MRVLVALVPVAGVIALALTIGGRSRVAPAGGAGGGGGGGGGAGAIVHYHARTVFRPAASSGASFAYEVDVADVWLSGSLGRRVETDYFYSHTGRLTGSPARQEMATDGVEVDTFQSGPRNPGGDLVEVQPAPRNAVCPLIVFCSSAVSDDPVAAVKELYRTGALRLSGRRLTDAVEVLTGKVSGVVLEVSVDPRSFVPLAIAAHFGPGPWPAFPATTTTISDYRRVPGTAANRKLLRMGRHPGARVLCQSPGGGGPTRPPSAQGCFAVPPRLSPDLVSPSAPLPGRIVAQVNLTVPGSRPGGPPPAAVAEVSRGGGRYFVRIIAFGMKPPGARNSYAVWVMGSAHGSQLLGFISYRTDRYGRLVTQGVLPPDPTAYRRLLITLERSPNPARPGKIVLAGTLRL